MRGEGRENVATTGVTQAAETKRPSAAADARQVVGFSFYRLDPAWRRLPRATRRRQAAELCRVVQAHTQELMVLTYSLIGLKADVDFLIWRVGRRLEQLQSMSGAILQTGMAGYLSMPYSYLSMTKRSTYVDRLDPEHQDRRRFITRPARRTCSSTPL